jgi:hypothetical protein
MFSLFMDNKRLLNLKSSLFLRTQATVVSHSTPVEQEFKIGIFDHFDKFPFFVLTVFSGILDAIISKVKTSGQDTAVEYIAPFFVFPFLFFNLSFRNAFTQHLMSLSGVKFSLWLSSLYSLTAKFCSRCFTKQAYYADYNIRFLAI